ncbi:MAG: hypothetical protein ACETWR_00405 [Anaerolineae bacterium]
MNHGKEKLTLALLVGLAAIAIVFHLLYRLEAQAAELPTDNPCSAVQAQDESPSHVWTITIVDNWKITGWYTSLALEPTAPYTPHISYHASFPKYDLNHASWNGAGWVITRVDSSGVVGYYTSLALEPTPPYTPHISYQHHTNGDLKHAWLSGTVWVKETIDSAGNVGSHTSLALAPTVPYTPHISYYDATNNDLKYAHQDGGGWVTETVDSEGDVGTYTSLALEPTAPYTPHISYYDLTHRDLKHAWLSGTVWVKETIDSAGNVGLYTSLALAPTMPYTPHISYYDATYRDLKYAHRDGGDWVTETVDSEGSVGWYTSLALEPTAPYTPHISYYDLIHGDLKHAWLSDTVWLSETVDSKRNVGRYTSIDLVTATASYTICISYYDDTLDALKLACSEPPAPQLTVTKQADPDPVQAGAQLTYTIRVTNTGNVDLLATVTDTLPAQVTPTGTLIWTTGIIAPDGIWVQTVPVTVAPDYTGPLINVVQVTTEKGTRGVYTETCEVQPAPVPPVSPIYLPITLKNFL